MMKGAEESNGGHCRELFQPLRNHRLAVADVDAPDEYVETIHNKGRLEGWKVWYRCKVFEG